MNRQSAGRSLELFFVDGNPEGLLTAEVFNLTGHVLIAPRQQVKRALQRMQAKHTGVYLLIEDETGTPQIYVGEGEDVSDRVKSHEISKAWWTKLVIVTTAANNLHKAHVKFLEARLVEIARSVGVAKLENANTPQRSSLSEASEANMEEFLESLLMVLPAVGLNFLTDKRRPESPVVASQAEETPIFYLATPRHGIAAQARMDASEFVVLRGSTCRSAWTSSHGKTGYGALHAELVRSGVVDATRDPAVFTENYAFRSPSAAAAVVGGRPANGRTDWKLASGMTLGEFEEAQLTGIDTATP